MSLGIGLPVQQAVEQAPQVESEKGEMDTGIVLPTIKPHSDQALPVLPDESRWQYWLNIMGFGRRWLAHQLMTDISPL